MRALLFAVLLSAAGAVPPTSGNAVARPAATLMASPNPVPAGQGYGTTTITWSTGDGSVGHIYLSRDGGEVRLFATGTGGSQEAPWILVGSPYDFRLYSEPERRTLLASVAVTRRSAVHGATLIAGACLLLLLVVALFSRRWFVEVAPVALVVAVLWVKLVHLSVWLGTKFVPDQQVVLTALAAFLLFVAAPLLWLPRAWRLAAALALDLVLTSVALADVIHFRFFEDVIGVPELVHAWQLPSVAASVRTAFTRQDLVYYLDIVGGGALAPLYWAACRRVPPTARHRWRLVPTGLLLLSVLLAIPAIRLVWLDSAWVFDRSVSRRWLVARLGILPFHVYDALVYLRYSGWGRLSVGEHERQRVRQTLDEWRRAQPPPSPLYGVARGRNVIVVQAESLHAFPVGLVVHDQRVMPRLSALAKESLHFVNFHDQTAYGRTSDGIFTSMQSLHPIEAGAVATRYPGNEYRGLPSILSTRGYRTMAAVGAPGEFWNMWQLHPRLGFQRSLFERDFGQSDRFGQGLADRDVVRQILPLLTAEPQPFLVLLITVSSHHPYDLPRRHRVLRLGELEGTLLGDYLHSVHYLDQAIGELVDGLHASGLLDRSLLVIYGDHHASLQEPPPLARLLGLPDGSGFHQWQLKKKLPFLIRLPHAEGAAVLPAAGGHLDVAPTVLGLLGIPADAVMLGRDLTRAGPALVVFRDGSFTDGAHYFISDWGPACYSMDTGQRLDCGPVADQQRAAQERLRISDLIVRGNLVPTLR